MTVTIGDLIIILLILFIGGILYAKLGDVEREFFWSREDEKYKHNKDDVDF